MPYATVVPSTTITAAWGNANVRDQVITPFANASARDSAITSPIEGMYADLADTNTLWRYSGSAWQIASRGLLGGTKWTGGGNLVTGLTTTELVVMTAASVTIPALTTAEISVGVRMLASVQGDTFVFKVRDTNVSGTERGELTWTAQGTGFGYNQYFKAYYENPSTSAVTVAFVVTAQRVGGSGSLTMIAGGSQHNTHILSYISGYDGVITSSPTP